MKLIRISQDPVFKPETKHPWERAAVFNAGAVYEKGLYHMIYRATNIGGHHRYGNYVNSFGYATSEDLLHWQRLDQPIMNNSVPQELRGPEDPRIVKIDDQYYMVYIGFSGRFWGDFHISLATSHDLIHWERRGFLLDEENNKDATLFPEKINNEYVLLHRRIPDIWLCSSKDLHHFRKHTIIMKTIPNSWEEQRIGAAGPPIRHPQGWLLFYHAVDNEQVYRLGVALLDANDPSKVLARHRHPIFEPEMKWEREGFVPNVVFSCATIEREDRYVIIYGAADTVIGAACILKKDVVFDAEDWCE